MTTEDRKHFFKQYEEFQEARGEDTAQPLFAKKPVDQFKLWIAVQEGGGHAEVTQHKGWARVGRVFDPPRTMTDLSFRIKKIYEVHMLPFEKAVEDGKIEGIYKPEKLALPQNIATGPKPPRKRASSGKPDNAQANTRPKRAKRASAATKDANNLLNRYIRVFWPDENEWFRGKITRYDVEQGMHKVDYDDGDEEVINLDEHNWQYDDPTSEDLVDYGRLDTLRTEADDLDQDGNVNKRPKNCVIDAEGYKVYIDTDKRHYEVFCLIPGLQMEDVKVQAWDTGKLLVAHNPQPSETTEKFKIQPVKHKIRLPKQIVATSARAIVSLHGQLYVKVALKSDSPEDKGEPAPQEESTAFENGSEAVGVASETNGLATNQESTEAGAPEQPAAAAADPPPANAEVAKEASAEAKPANGTEAADPELKPPNADSAQEIVPGAAEPEQGQTEEAGAEAGVGAGDTA